MYPDTNSFNYLLLRFPHLPDAQVVVQRHIGHLILPLWRADKTLWLNGKFHGPLIHQGMLIYHGTKAIYVTNELTPLPGNNNHIATAGILIDSQLPTPIIIPRQYVNETRLKHNIFPQRLAESNSFIESISKYSTVEEE